MNWEAISAIGEIIGAIVVVITILYLAVQIRQNSQALQISALRDTTSQWNQWGAMLATTPDLAAIVARGNLSYHDLPRDEALRYGAYVQSFFDCAESNRSLICQHKVEKDLSILKSIVARRVNIRGFSDWWIENTDDYEEGFVEWIESLRTIPAATDPDRIS